MFGKVPEIQARTAVGVRVVRVVAMVGRPHAVLLLKRLLLTPVGKLDSNLPLCVKFEANAWNKNVFAFCVQIGMKLVCESVGFSAGKSTVC